MSGPPRMQLDETLLRSLAAAGSTRLELATVFGCSVGPVRKALLRLGLRAGPRRVRNLEERFWEKVEYDGPSGCWLWTSALDFGGYGICWIGDGVSKRAHRLAFEFLREPIPDGLTLDHLCRNRRCVNPDHLDPCTAGENAARAPNAPYWVKARQTHCKRGHELPAPTPRSPTDLRGTRRCKQCHRKPKTAAAP